MTLSPTYLLGNHPSAGPQAGSSTPYGLSPAQVRHAYGFDQITFQNGTVTGNGKGETIAIIDAYDDPSIATDLSVFDQQYGLPAPASFTKVGINSSGTASTSTFPPANSGWAGEIELDVEWAHAIAPGASILLVEASSASDTNLMQAVNYARQQPGVVAVSMSWGGSEFSGETSYDSNFTTPSGHPGVTFFGSSGDSGSPTIWPALSTHVVGVGGTSLSVSSQGTYLGESGWSGSGGSPSLYIPQPSYQAGLVISDGSGTISASGMRTGPDVSYDADPNTGVSVYGSYGFGGWSQVGGTSAAAPQWAGLMAITDQGRALANEPSLDGYSQTLPALYKLPASDFHDVTSGSNGGYQAGPGYDLVTGRGTPIANLVVRDLIGSTGTGTGKPPTIATPAHVVSQTATTASLSVLGADTAGESTLTYTWAVASGPAGVAFSPNGTNASKNSTASFQQAGTYTLQVTATDQSGLTATSQVTVSIAQTLTSVSVSPGSATVAPSGTQQFTAQAVDQFGNAMTQQPTFSWTVSNTSLGSISSSGLFTAGKTTGSLTVQATASGHTNSASVTIASSSVAFTDNFSNGASQWTVTSGFGDYYLTPDDDYSRLEDINNGAVDRIVAGQSTWANYSYQATLNIDINSTGSASLMARVQDNMHLYYFGYNIVLGEWMIAMRNGTTVKVLATSAPATVYGNVDYTVNAVLNGTSLKLYVNGVLQVSTTDSTYGSGKIGFTATNATAELDNVIVTLNSGSQASQALATGSGGKHSTAAIAYTPASTSSNQASGSQGLFSQIVGLLSSADPHHWLNGLMGWWQ
jgi:subtilase family serine protease